MLMECKKMPPETLILSAVGEQTDIYPDICKAPSTNVTTSAIVVTAAVYSQFTHKRWRLMKGSRRRGKWLRVNKMKSKVGFGFCI